MSDGADSDALSPVTLDVQQAAEVIAHCHINLAGKDYFTVREAAAYACISIGQWRARVQPEFPAGKFCGKLVYRRVDVERYFEQNTRWPRAPDTPMVAAPMTRSADEIRAGMRRLPGRSRST
jgi:hypothetical protein